MKSLWLQFVVIVVLRGVLSAADLTYSSITTNEEAEIKQKLEAYEKGDITAQELIDNAGSEGCRKFTEYYLLHTNDLSAKAKFPLSLCYAGFGRYPQAAKLAQDYLNVYTNDAHGWRILGSCFVFMNSTNEAIQAYCTAVKLGDKKSCEPLAGVAMQSEHWDIVRDIIPQLMAVQHAKDTPTENRINVVSLLLYYSLKADRKDIFIKTIKGENMKELVSEDSIKTDINSGCHIFEGKDIEAIHREFEKANGNKE